MTIRKEFEMARIYGRRAPRRNRNRIYTIISIVFIFGIIAYLNISGNKSKTELIPNSNGTTIPSGSEESSSAGNTSSGSSLNSSLPNWATSSDGEAPVPNQELPGTGQSERITEMGNATLTASGGNTEMTTSMQPPVQFTNSEADMLIAQANELMKQGISQIIPACDKFNEALRSRTINAQQAEFVKKQLSSLADDWLFNKSVLQGDTLCEYYKIQSGDRLQVIGEKNNVPYELLMTINNISDAKKIQVGQTIKILKGPFHAKVYRSSFTMDVYLKNTYVRTFKVGLGLAGTETPTGMWKVKPGGKLIEPVWTDPQGKTHYPSDADYPLGSRWVALEGVSGDAVGKQGFAIHGTREPQSLGTASSQGCIRLENGSAVLVYNMLIPAYSTVEVLN